MSIAIRPHLVANQMKKLTIILIALFLFFLSSHRAQAADLIFDLGVPSGQPIFVIDNTLPGDSETRTIKITNNDTTPHLVKVRSQKTSETKNFSQILQITIKANTTDIFGGSTGTKTVSQFFNASDGPNGMNLTTINPGQTVNYIFTVFFPPSADNAYQKASIVFDLIFGSNHNPPSSDHLVINEVYYQPDSGHGKDCPDSCPKDNGLLADFPDLNFIDFKHNDTCFIFPQLDFFRLFKFKPGFFSCGYIKGKQNDEWIELYNPTGKSISLKNWTLTDNSDKTTIIHANKSIKSHGFALLSKDADTWKYWNEDKNAVKIELGRFIGDGLANAGDHLILKNPSGQTIDAMGWGSDTAIWNPAIPLAPLGDSLERLTPGFDTDLPTDWLFRFPPTPGS